MSLVISHNIPALFTYNALSGANKALSKSIKQLSTGLRINSAADDIAGLAISERMRSQVNAVNKSLVNTQDGISMVQTAEGALADTQSVLQRMRELTVQAANDTLTQQDREYIQAEVDALRGTIDSIGNSTQFNNKKLLNGEASASWSSNNLDTRAVIKGGLRVVDEFGQKSSAEGNYKITVKTEAGLSQAQKSDIFTIKHENVMYDKVTYDSNGVSDVSAKGMTPGNYVVGVQKVEEPGDVAVSAYTLEFDPTDTSGGITITFDTPSIRWDYLVMSFAELGSIPFFNADLNVLDIDYMTSTGRVKPGDHLSNGEFASMIAEELINMFDGKITRNETDGTLNIMSAGISHNEATGKTELTIQVVSEGDTPQGLGNFVDTVILNANTEVKDVFKAAFSGHSLKDQEQDAGYMGSSEINARYGIDKVSMSELKVAFDADFSDAITVGNPDNPGEIKFTLAGYNQGKAVTAAMLETVEHTDPYTGIITNLISTTRMDVMNGIAKALDGKLMDDGIHRIAASASEYEGLVIKLVRNDGESAKTISGADFSFVDPANSADVTFAGLTDIFNAETVTAAQNFDALDDGLLTIVKTANADNKNEVLRGNADVLFEVVAVDRENHTITCNAKSIITMLDGTVEEHSLDGIVLKAGNLYSNAKVVPDYVGGIQIEVGYHVASAKGGKMWVDEEDALGLGMSIGPSGTQYALQLGLETGMDMAFDAGDKFVLNLIKGLGADLSAETQANLADVTIQGKLDETWPEAWGDENTDIFTNPTKYTVDTSKVAGSEVSFKNFVINQKTGEVTKGEVNVTFNENFKPVEDETLLSTFSLAYLGKTAQGGVRLRDLDKFWNSHGRFLLDDPQTIKITQGDGRTAEVTIYATDTLDKVAEKLNNAIGRDLGQWKHLKNGADELVKFISHGDTFAGSFESVEGTFVINSAVSGSNGTLTFSGNQDIINALSLNVLQQETDNVHTVSVRDAHTDAVVASNMRITGNKLAGVINPNVDIVFDTMAGIEAVWDDRRKKFTYEDREQPSETILHLSDNTTTFQIGARTGADIAIDLGDMRSEALGLNSVIVTDRKKASRSITIVDGAIDRVSRQRAKLGAYRNRLEYTVSTLTTMAENLTSAESAIRDADTASAMLEFAKLQIMLQAGTSMLTQANQLPQNVLSLVR